MEQGDRDEAMAPPAGEPWSLLPHMSTFTRHVGPFFIRHEALEPGERVRLGFRVRKHQCNPRDVCHGGMLASFLDLCLARGLMAEEGGFGSTPTINMTIDYLAAAPLGAWVESRVTALHRTRQLGFAQALVLSGGRLLVRGSGTFKRTRPLSAGGQG
ncbi:PaaI family thioesterase [Sphingomonas sp. YL-JM2C]